MTKAKKFPILVLNVLDVDVLDVDVVDRCFVC